MFVDVITLVLIVKKLENRIGSYHKSSAKLESKKYKLHMDSHRCINYYEIECKEPQTARTGVLYSKLHEYSNNSISIAATME